MNNIIRWVTGALLLLGLAVTSAEAMPIAAPSLLTDQGAITLVSGGCGPFGHRTYYGGCAGNHYGFYRHPHFYGGPRFYGRPRFYRPRYFRPRPFYGRRCFVRLTFFGPRRFCR